MGKEKIHMEYNNISDISPLEQLSNLVFLNMRNNDISDISVLEGPQK